MNTIIHVEIQDGADIMANMQAVAYMALATECQSARGRISPEKIDLVLQSGRIELHITGSYDEFGDEIKCQVWNGNIPMGSFVYYRANHVNEFDFDNFKMEFDDLLIR